MILKLHFAAALKILVIFHKSTSQNQFIAQRWRWYLWNCRWNTSSSENIYSKIPLSIYIITKKLPTNFIILFIFAEFWIPPRIYPSIYGPYMCIANHHTRTSKMMGQSSSATGFLPTNGPQTRPKLFREAAKGMLQNVTRPKKRAEKTKQNDSTILSTVSLNMILTFIWHHLDISHLFLKLSSHPWTAKTP